MRDQGCVRCSPGPWLAALLASVVLVALHDADASAALNPSAGVSSAPGQCSAGARTLAPYGSRMYPDTGNGGYTSMHTDVHLLYDAARNRFLPGNHVVLGEQATQCLSSFTLDFERTSANRTAGPNMTVESVSVNGRPATFKFVQPTYPGDPNGPGDLNPQAHEASQTNPVGGPAHNPLPPACSPELLTEEPSQRDSLDGRQCPANKLLITPAAPLGAGSSFTVAVYYSGRPGVHNDGDGTVEGWFHSGAGSFVATEPVGSEDWMPLNDHPSAKPTYDFFETVEQGKVAIAGGVLGEVMRNPPSSQFPGGSVTWHWHSAAPIASYLVQSSVGDYELSARIASSGITYYTAQDESIPPAQRSRNRALIDTQPEITEFESRWGGPFPFASDGSLVGTSTEFTSDEEMQTMISFSASTVELPVLWHENFHQWWGDNVSEGGYEMTFFKEGLAEWMESYVFPARRLEPAAFDAFLARRFNRTYRSGGSFWTVAPSEPFPYSLFESPPTYERPAAAYEALHQILGEPRFAQALAQIQQEHGGASVSEAQLEATFQGWLPVQSAACHARLAEFFSEWFDTAYPPGGGANRPEITGPGLAGHDFYEGGCSRGGLANEGASGSPAEAGALPPETEPRGQRRAP